MALYALMGGTCPTGWTIMSSNDGRFIYATNSGVGGTAGDVTYNHSHGYSQGVGPCCCGPRAPGTMPVGGATVGIVPIHVKFVLCQIPTGLETGFPSKTILPTDSTCPTGWAEYSAGNTKFILFTETDLDAGASVAQNLGNHYHTLPGFTNYSTAGTNYAWAGSNVDYANAISAATDLTHIKLMLCKKN